MARFYSKVRRKKGNQITELGPAMFILLVVVLFPLAALVYMGMGVGCGWFLNHMSTRAASVVPGPQMPTALTKQEDAWKASGLAKFTNANVVSNVATRADINGKPGDDVVRVTTIIEIQPFVQIPFVPLGPYRFTFNGERPIEERGII